MGLILWNGSQAQGGEAPFSTSHSSETMRVEMNLHQFGPKANALMLPDLILLDEETEVWRKAEGLVPEPQGLHPWTLSQCSHQEFLTKGGGALQS